VSLCLKFKFTAIDVHIAALRKKLGPRFDNIETVRGVCGYRFRTDE
jgi:DNA-binding response OmpR family regulator